MPEVEIEGRRLQLSRLDKVMYPETGFTKAQVIDYYSRIAPVLLPHLRDRPLTMHRFPDGVASKSFYEKQTPSHRPDWFTTVPVPVTERTLDSPVANDTASLVWMANMASLEVHPLLARHPLLHQPTKLTFDLDPGPPATIEQCCEVALLLRDLLAELDLQLFPKTSGSKGLQIDLPLNVEIGYSQTQPFALAVAQLLERRHPDLVVSQMDKSLRTGKVFIDWSQNSQLKTTVAPYSLRARPRPAVSTPISWEEIEKAIDVDAPPLVFETDDVLRRVERIGDLHAPVESMQQELPSLGAG